MKKFIIFAVIMAVGIFIGAQYFGSPTNVTNVTQVGETATGAIEFNTGKIVYSSLANNVLQKRTVVLTNATLIDLEDNPLLLVPQAPLNRVNQIVSITGYRDFGSESYDRSGTDESFEVKWGNLITASGLNGQQVLGASFSQGFLTGGDGNTVSSRGIEYWTPSGLDVVGEEGEQGFGRAGSSTSYSATQYASQSAIYLTGLVNNEDSAFGTRFIFDVIYRVLFLPHK